MSATWQFWAVLSAAFAAATAVLAKVGVKEVTADFATLVRTAVVLAMMTAIVAVTGQYRQAGSVPARAWWFLGWSGFATGASWFCYFRALKLGDASRVAPIDKLSILLVAGLGVLLLGERLTARNWAGVILVAVGAVLVGMR